MTISSSPFVLTFFSDLWATDKREERLTLEELAEQIRAEMAAEKTQLPLLKLARFGRVRSNKNCLRHDNNVLAITGAEVDYDDGELSLDEAVKIIEPTFTGFRYVREEDRPLRVG